jgi:hypothetical protein
MMIDDSILGLSGKCRNHQCMEATEGYIANMVAYYTLLRQSADANFDLSDYWHGWQKVQARERANTADEMALATEVHMQDSLRDMDRFCD